MRATLTKGFFLFQTLKFSLFQTLKLSISNVEVLSISNVEVSYFNEPFVITDSDAETFIMNQTFKTVALGGRRQTMQRTTHVVPFSAMEEQFKPLSIEKRPLQEVIVSEDNDTDAQKAEEHQTKWRCSEGVLDLHDGTYPLISSYNFVVQSQRLINPNLSVYFIGINTGPNTRAWSLTLQSPPCFVKFIASHYEGEGEKCRALLTPQPLDGNNVVVFPMDFMAFIDHVDQVSDRLEQIMREQYGLDTSNWSSPMKKTEEGIFAGMFAKVKSPIARRSIENNPNRVRCSLRLTCVYHTPERSGLSFELTGAYNS